MTENKTDTAVLGNLSIDFIKLPYKEQPFIVLGGSAAYASLAIRPLDISSSIISKVGSDFPEDFMTLLSEQNIDLSQVKKIENMLSTSFDLTYSSDLSERILRLKSQALTISSDDLLKDFKTKILHIGSIAGEVDLALIEYVRGKCDILSLDPQGLLRIFDESGKVLGYKRLEPNLLCNVDLFKSSAEEIISATGKSDLESAVGVIHDCGVEVVIVTKGARGAMISSQGVVYNIPAYPSRKFVDPTGAGDVFIGAFLAESCRKNDLLWNACVGCALASLAVEEVGPAFFVTREEIYRRANVLYAKEIKQ